MNEHTGRQAHWDHIYETKATNQVSWYQTRPGADWELMQFLGIPRNAAIIDVGGGDSNFVDFLLAQGFSDLTVLDISQAAITRAQERLGRSADSVQWIRADIQDYAFRRRYDLWHDRAVFHFFVHPEEALVYATKAAAALSEQGRLILGTFGERGPEKCSGLPVARYTEQSMVSRLTPHFEKIRCMSETHETPSHSTQDFLFCAFART